MGHSLISDTSALATAVPDQLPPRHNHHQQNYDCSEDHLLPWRHPHSLTAAVTSNWLPQCPNPDSRQKHPPHQQQAAFWLRHKHVKNTYHTHGRLRLSSNTSTSKTPTTPTEGCALVPTQASQKRLPHPQKAALWFQHKPVKNAYHTHRGLRFGSDTSKSKTHTTRTHGRLGLGSDTSASKTPTTRTHGRLRLGSDTSTSKTSTSKTPTTRTHGRLGLGSGTKTARPPLVIQAASRAQRTTPHNDEDSGCRSRGPSKWQEQYFSARGGEDPILFQH